MIKEKYLGAYMKTARVFAELSTARRKQVGAVVVKDDRIISIDRKSTRLNSSHFL
jgi:deoxycytidylate deaminase